MEQRFALAEGRGWLTVREAQGRAVCQAVLPGDDRGLYKCWLRGAGGEALLGTFVPEGGGLALKRTVTVGELTRQGAWPPTGARAGLAFTFSGGEAPPPGWSRERSPGRLLGEPLLAEAAPGPALVRRESWGFQLAYPYEADKPFPLTPIFCFARLERLEGRDYLCFPFRPGGCPRLEQL